MTDGKLGKAVMENEMSHSDEDNLNFSIPQSKTTKLQKRRVKEGDVSVSNKKKKKSKTTLTTDGWEGVGEVLIALKSPAEVRRRQAPISRVQSRKSATPLPPALEVPKATDGDGVNLAANSVHPSGSNSVTPLPFVADADVGSAIRNPTLSEMLANDSSLQPKKQCPPTVVVTVNVERHKVKLALADTALYILYKYGDVVSVTSFKGSLFTYLLQNVCLIFQKLEQSDFADLTIEEFEAISIDLHDFQKMNVNVGWLLSRLEDILNGKKVLQTLNQELMEAKEKFKRFLEKSLVDGI